ncbi:OmpA family protein [Lentzea fradiae]|uniref:OmpA family protein n=1 Tax=Lentzea fradiae TaxID=200378 RepID=UPI00115FC785|nr:OmpA family protein [Lentzea fradiae]
MLVSVLLGAVGIVPAACSSEEPQACPTENPPRGLAIAASDRSNSPRPSWPTELEEELSKLLSDVESGRSDLGVTLVRADGVPTIGCVRFYKPPKGTEQAKTYARERFRETVRHDVRELRAIEPEANTLAALGKAGAAAGPDGTVALIDSGLQTALPLDFRSDGLLDGDPDRIVSELVRMRALPDLSGRKVILANIGYTAPPQAALDEGQRGRLIELWQRIAEKSGAREVVTVMAPNTTASGTELPMVSQVPVPSSEGVSLGCDVTLPYQDKGDTGFVEGETAFRDENAARAALKKVADWLVGNPGTTATVTGSVAHYGDDDPNGLSLARAEQVRRVLRESGVEQNRVRTAGEGWGPFPSKTAAPDPVSDALNRRFVVALKC